MNKNVYAMALKDESHSSSSEDTKDDSGDIREKHGNFHQSFHHIDKRTIIIKGSRLKSNNSNNILGQNEIEKTVNNSNVLKNKAKKGKFSLSELNNPSYKEFLMVKQAFSTFNYPFVQDLKGPIYYSKGKDGTLFLAKIRKVQSVISRAVFDKGLKYLYRAPKDVPEMKFWNQRFYYYSKFDEGIKMDYESWYSVTPEDLAFYISKIANR